MESEIGNVSLSERAVSEIRQRVIHGELPPGTSFSEGEIASQLQMSKAPIREALAALRRQGWVEVIPRSGYRVAPVTLRGMQDLFDLRLWLEPQAAALAAKRAGHYPDQVAALREFCDREEGESRADKSAWLTDHYRAHRRIAVLSGNAELDRVLSDVLLKMERYHALDVVNDEPGTGSAKQAHRELVEAIAAQDATTARELTAAHIKLSRDQAVAAILDSEALRTFDLTVLGQVASLSDQESRMRSA